MNLPAVPEPVDPNEELTTTLKMLESELRSIGLYVDNVETMQPVQVLDPTRLEDVLTPHSAEPLVVVVDCLVGDLAWSDRVQNPSRASIDDEFREMQVDLEGQQHADRRAEIERRLKAGEDLYGDGFLF